MQSILNESNFLVDLVNDINSTRKSNNDKMKKSGTAYLKGSIARYTKDLVMTFPMIVDDTLSLDTAQMISVANERNIVTMLQMMFASMSISGSEGVEILSRLHKNIDSLDIEDVIDKLNSFAESYFEGESELTKAEIRDAIQEMCYQLKTPKKVFPTESLSEPSVNRFLVRESNMGSMYVTETEDDLINIAKRSIDRSNAVIGTDPGQRSKDDLSNEREEDKFRYQILQNQKKDTREEKKDTREELNLLNNLNSKRLVDTDVKKANELQPTPIIINFNNVENEDRKSFVAGVKSRMVIAEAMDIVERIVSKEKSSLSLKNLIKATSGEISFTKDFLLCIKQAKINAKNAVKKGPMAKLWSTLEKRSAGNVFNKLFKKSNDASAITTLVINQETVNYIKSSFRIDLNVIKTAKMIMDEYNLLCLMIADESNEMVKVLYDGNNSFEVLSYNVLSKDVRDRNFKNTINLLTKGGK